MKKAIWLVVSILGIFSVGACKRDAAKNTQDEGSIANKQLETTEQQAVPETQTGLFPDLLDGLRIPRTDPEKAEIISASATGGMDACLKRLYPNRRELSSLQRQYTGGQTEVMAPASASVQMCEAFLALASGAAAVTPEGYGSFLATVFVDSSTKPSDFGKADGKIPMVRRVRSPKTPVEIADLDAASEKNLNECLSWIFGVPVEELPFTVNTTFAGLAHDAKTTCRKIAVDAESYVKEFRNMQAK